MFATAVGFNDHQYMVLQFVGMDLDGEQLTRWKFPLDALQDHNAVDWVSQIDEGVLGLEAFQRSQAVFCEAARRYNAQAPMATPQYLQLQYILRHCCR